jgi:IclR family transcriptional regulator, KDG regulon repressor
MGFMKKPAAPSENLDEIDDGDEAPDRTAPPRAPLRAMHILIELAKTPSGTSLVRLSEALKLPKTSVFSLLRSLEAGNFVVSDNGYHKLDQEAFRMAAAILHHDSLAGRLRPVLEWLQDNTHETVMLAVAEPDWSKLVFADVIEAASALRFTARVGAERPLYSTSVGLALLAYATPDQQKRYIKETKLAPLTPTTITSASRLQQMLKQVRSDGYVVNSGSVNGLAAVAAPIFDSRGALAASVGLAGPSTRVEQRSDEFIALVVEAARRMSEILGFGRD